MFSFCFRGDHIPKVQYGTKSRHNNQIWPPPLQPLLTTFLFSNHWSSLASIAPLMGYFDKKVMFHKKYLVSLKRFQCENTIRASEMLSRQKLSVMSRPEEMESCSPHARCPMQAHSWSHTGAGACVVRKLVSGILLNHWMQISGIQLEWLASQPQVPGLSGLPALEFVPSPWFCLF